MEVDESNGIYEEEYDEYEIIDDCDQALNGEDDIPNEETILKPQNDHPGISKMEGDYGSKMKVILERTGYRHEVTSGQHKYGGPPPDYQGPTPGPGQEVYVGKLPNDILEDELIPLFERCGTIYELRLMMKTQSSENKGFAFVTYVDREAAKRAHNQYNNYEVRPKHPIIVNISIPNTRLYIGNIKKTKSKQDIFQEVSKYIEGLREVIIYNQPDNPELRNRGFAFLDFESHKHASEAKKKLASEPFQYFLFNMNCIVEWAEPQDEPSEEEMKKVKVLYIRNLKSNVSQEDVEALFQPYGMIEKVKRIKDYCFVHFVERLDALRALEELKDKKIKDSIMNITLARPPSEPKLKEKKILLPSPKSTMTGSMRGVPSVMRGGLSAMRGAPSIMRGTAPYMMGAPAPMRGGQNMARGGLAYNHGYSHQDCYDDYDYEDDYYYDESNFDYWDYNQPVRPPPTKTRGSMRGRPLLNRPPLMSTPPSSLHPPPKPLMERHVPKQSMQRFTSPGSMSGAGIRMSPNQGFGMKRKAPENVFGVDNPSKQTRFPGDFSDSQITIGQNQHASIKNEWDFMPIAQKPLNQMMMDYGEQWF